jgi:hypothetical protein
MLTTALDSQIERMEVHFMFKPVFFVIKVLGQWHYNAVGELVIAILL